MLYGISVCERHYVFAVYIYASNEREFSFCEDEFPACIKLRDMIMEMTTQIIFHIREYFPESAKLNKFQ